MKKNVILWVIAFAVVNTAWFFVSQQGATQEINRPGADFQTNRNAEVVSLFGSDAEIEIYHCFESINGAELNASVKVELDSKIIYSWEGTTEQECITETIESQEGNIVVITEIEEGIDATVSVKTWPMKSAFIPGVVLFSILTVIVAYGEIFVRNVVKEKISKKQPKVDKVEDLPEIENTGIWQDPIR